MLTLDEFFSGYPESRALFDALRLAIDAVGPADMRTTKSQVAFKRRRGFAWAWIPDRYLGGGHAPLVLSLALPARDPSRRWKEVVEPAPGRYMHHLELWTAADIDAEVAAALQRAWEAAM